MRLYPCVLILAASACLHAAPVTLSYDDAKSLYVALNTIQSGTTATNGGLIADDINTLYPRVKATDNALNVATHRLAALGQSPDPAKSAAVNDDFEAFMQRPITLELSPILITDAEFADSKMTPRVLALIKRLLSPPPNPKSK